MFRKWNRVLAFLLSIVLITTTFGSDFTSTFAYAAEDAQDLQNLAAENGDLPEIFEEGQTISDLDEEKKDTETQKETQEKPQEESQEKPQEESQKESQEVGDEIISEEEGEKDPETVVTDLEEEATSEGEDEEPAEPEYELEFNQSQEVNGIEVSLWAAKEVLPDDAVLSVEAVSEDEEEQIKELIDGETGDDVTVEKTISFDININAPSMETEENPSGKVQPKEGTVAVTFNSVEEVSEGDLEVYHVADNMKSATEVENVNINVEEETVSFDASHFSTYTVAIYHNRWDYNRENDNYLPITIQTKNMDGSQLNVPELNNQYFKANYGLEEFSPSTIAANAVGYTFKYATKDSGTSSKKITSFKIEEKDNGKWSYPRYTYTLKCKVEGNPQWQSVPSMVYFWYEEDKVPVAVYATDGLSSGNLNDHSAELRQLLGLGWVQDDGYFPIGVVWLKQSDIDRTLDSGNSRENIDALIDSIGSIDVSYLQNGGGRNASNTVALNKDMIQRDAGGTQKSYKTALLNWYWDGAYQPEHTEQNAPYSGKTNIKEVQGYGHYKYHLDVRFKANAVEYKRVYSENDQITSDSPEELISYSYLSGTQMTENDAKAVFDSFNLPRNKNGFNYAGLYSDAACTEPFSTFTVSDTTDGYTIYAKYSKTTSHTVTFSMGTQPNATPVPRPQTVTHGQTASKPETDPAVADNTYVFDGWYLGDDKYDFSTLVTTDITLVAHWKENTTTYTVNHYKQKIGGDASRHDTENYSLDKSETSDPVVVNSTQTPAVKTYTGFTAPATQTVTVEVKSDGTPKTVVNYYYTRNNYTVTYNANGGTGTMEPQTVPYEDTVTISENSFTREHYRFDGWKDANGNSYAVGAAYPGEGAAYANLELFAQWKALTTVTISPIAVEGTYNGQALCADFTSNLDTTKYELRNTGSITYSVASITDAGVQTYSVTGVQGVKVYEKSSNTDVTRDFELVASNATATMTVTPITIKVGTGSATQNFNGKVLKCTDIFIDGSATAEAVDDDGYVLYKPLGENSQETIKLHTTSWRIFPGDEPNNYAVDYAGGAKAQNYNVVTNNEEGKGLGRLYVLTNSDDDKFIIKADDQTFDYDGTPHSYNKAIVVNNPAEDAGYTVDIENVQTTGSVTYANESGVNTVVRNSVRILDKDRNDVTAQFREQDIKLLTGTLTVNKKAVTVTALGAHKTYDGRPIDKDFVKSFNESDKEYTVTALADNDYEVVSTNFEGDVKNVEGNQSKAGNHVVKEVKIYHRNQDGSTTEVTNSYQITEAAGVVYVDPKEIHIETEGDEKEYNGVALTKDAARVVGLVDGEQATIHAVGSQLTVGQSKNDYAKDNDGNPVITWGSILSPVKSSNYVHNSNADVLGDLVVNSNETAQVTISVPSAAQIYNGTALTNGDASIEVVGKGISKGDFTVSNVTFETVTSEAVSTASNSVSITDAGSVTYRVSGYKIVAKDGTNATSYFTKVSKPEATLTVYPRTVKVTSVSDHKTYDGTALTNSDITKELVSKVIWDNKEYAQTGDVFVNGEGFTYNVTGSVTYVSEGEVDNAFTFAANEGTAAGNYRILPEFGKLYITNRSDAEKYVVEVKANSYEDKYDGAEHKAEGFKTTYPGAEEPIEGTEFTIDNRSYVVEGIRASRTEKNVPEEGTDYTVAVQGTPVVYALDETAENGKVNVTEQFALTTTDGSIKITPRNVTLTSVSGSKTYDGDELTGATLIRDKEAYFGEVKIDDSFKYPVTEDGIVITGDGFVDGEGATYTVTGSQTTPTFSSNAYTFTLKEGTLARNYNISKVEGTLTVNSRDAKYEIAVYPNSKTEVYDGKVKAVSGFSKVVYADTNEFDVGKDGKLKFSIDGNEYTITGLEVNNVENAVNAGEYLVTISNVGNQYKVLDAQGNDVKSEFRLTTGQGKLEIRKRVVILTSKGDTKQYDGKPLKKEKVDVSWPKDGDYPQTYGFVKGDGVTYSNFKSQTLVTEGDGADNTFDYTFSGSSADNYEIIKQYGKLKVTDRKNPFKVTVKANSKTETYTGDYITVSGFEKKVGKKTFVETENGLEFTEGGVKFYITGLTATQTMRDVNRKTAADKVKSYEVPVSGKAVVKDADGNDVTNQFKVDAKPGELMINPIKITFTSGDAEKEYDGDPLTNDEVKVTSGAFAQGEEAVFTVTGSQTLPTKNRVKENNTFTYKLVNTREANYDVKTKFGSLWVKNRSDANKWKIELKGNSKTDYYNGNKQTISGFEKMTFEFNGHTYYVSGVTSSAKGTDVLYKDGKVVAKDTKIEGKPKVKDEAGHDVTKSFKVTVKEGTLLINPRPVTLTSADGRKKYDGTPLTTFDLVKKGELDKEVTVGGMGFVKNHGKKIHYTVTGSQTIVGSSSNEFTYKFENSIKDIGKNYAITKNYGTLTVETRGADNRFEVVVVANSDEFLYDGTEHSVSGFKEVRVKVGENKYDTYQVKGGVLEFKLNGETFKITDVSTIAGVATDVMLNEVTDETGAKKYAEAPAAVVSVSDTSLAKVTDSNNNPVTSEFAVYSENGTLTINRRKVTLAAGSASKDFDGKALTCPEYIIRTGEGIDGFAVYAKDGKEVNEKNGITVTTSGSALRPEDSPAENEIAKVDFDGVIAKASNYIVTTEKGKLTINSLEKKIVLDITLELDQDGGNNKEVTYNGKQQSMDVTIGITPKKITETEETQTTTEGGNTETPSPITQNSDDNDEGDASDLSAMIGKLMSLGSITVYAAEGEDIFEDVEQLKYNSTATFTYGDTTFVVSGITLEGGAGTDVGEYPVTINLKNLSVTVGKTVDGKVVADEEAPVKEFAFNVIKPETSAEDNNVVGVLNIVEKEITVSTGSASKDYDGNPLTSNVASIDGIVNGETYKITATGSRTEVGTSKNTYKIDWAAEDNDYTAKETNYKIVGENLGDLRVDRVSSGGGGGDDTPVFFTLAAPAPSGAVLGAQRVVGDGPAVLGARRSSTDDNTNSMARVFAMVAAAAIAVTVMITGKKKKDEEEG